MRHASQRAARPTAPDYGYYSAARDDRGGGRATLSVARKLAHRRYRIRPLASPATIVRAGRPGVKIVQPGATLTRAARPDDRHRSGSKGDNQTPGLAIGW